MQTPLVSIIVPCYQQAQYLPETLDSVLAQTFSNWECIIVNDGSPDNTEIVAIDYCAKDSRFQYIKQNNQGLARARNNGIRMSKGEYVLPLDSDDKIGPSYLEKAVSHIQGDPSCKVVYCKAEYFDGRSGPWHLRDYCYYDMLWDNCIFCSSLYRRSDFDRVGGYNPNMKYGLEDWDFWLSILSPEDTVLCIDEVLFYYRSKAVSMHITMQTHSHEMFRQIVNNHPTLYSPYLDEVLWWHSKAEELDTLQKKLSAVYSSRSYRLAVLLTSPLRFLKRALSLQ